MSYNRKIFYMNLYEGDEKKGSAGFVKVIEKKEDWEVQVCLLGVAAIFDGERVLEALEGENNLAKEMLCLEGGRSVRQYNWEKKGDLNRLLFRIRVSEDCMLASGTPALEKVENNPVEKEDNLPEKSQELWMEQEILWTEQEREPLPKENRMECEEKMGGEDMMTQVIDRENEKQKVENRKWKQICKTYPRITPFDDFREYIKLELRDMVLLSEKKYSLVENSFLLHGYYNYGHIILWRKEKAPVKYYVGVPGNFYDKEKQVAVLYGFESFEGAVEPAGEGDFGYYMTEVSL